MAEEKKYTALKSSTNRIQENRLSTSKQENERVWKALQGIAKTIILDKLTFFKAT